MPVERRIDPRPHVIPLDLREVRPTGIHRRQTAIPLISPPAIALGVSMRSLATVRRVMLNGVKHLGVPQRRFGKAEIPRWRSE